MRNLLRDMGLNEYVAEPTVLLGDNKQAGKWGREDMITNGNRFIERQYYKVRDWIRKGELDSRWINTKLNCSDIMTKAVSTETADTMGSMLSGMTEFPETPESEDAIRRF